MNVVAPLVSSSAGDTAKQQAIQLSGSGGEQKRGPAGPRFCLGTLIFQSTKVRDMACVDRRSQRIGGSGRLRLLRRGGGSEHQIAVLDALKRPGPVLGGGVLGDSPLYYRRSGLALFKFQVGHAHWT